MKKNPKKLLKRGFLAFVVMAIALGPLTGCLVRERDEHWDHHEHHDEHWDDHRDHRE